MSHSIRDAIVEVLERVDRPGTFCVEGSVPAFLPGLEVEGLGPVGLPLSDLQAKALRKVCEQAPYGKGERTLVDTSVRKVWRLLPDRFALRNPEWDRFVAEAVARVGEEWGLEGPKLEAHLYDLLLYERGSFFLPHRDGEKLDRMVATLVVALPSPHEGGELVVRHDGQERVIDFGGDDAAFRIQYAAFYADCEHEVRPLERGYRLCLVYNLTLARSKKALTAPRSSRQVDALAGHLHRWSRDDSAEKLIITLDHRYTRDGLSWDTLKGVDQARADVLAEAAGRSGCRAYLALLTLWESGSAEYADGGSPYGRRRGRYGSEDDPGLYEMGEIFDSSLTAENAVDREGNRLPLPNLVVEEDELLDPDALTDIEPEEEFEGYTGNAGMTLARWYRHAAILIWPDRLHFEVLCGQHSPDAVPELKLLIGRWRKADGEAAESIRSQALDLARAILGRWPEVRYRLRAPESPAGESLLEALIALDAPTLVGRLIGETMVRDVSLDPGKSLVKACEAAGWETFRAELAALMRGTVHESIERNVGVLERICAARPRRKQGWAELCGQLARELAGAIEALDRQPRDRDWRIQEVDRAAALAGLARSLILTGQAETLAGLVDHAIGTPALYPLIEAHVPALKALKAVLAKPAGPCGPAASRWLAWCRGELEAMTAEAPSPPADQRRAAPIRCRCDDCAELKRFLEDPHEPVHRFRLRQDRRSHLEGEILTHRLDLDRRTETKGSPHTLVCTKNMATYQGLLEAYHAAQADLAAIRAIESGRK